MGLKFQLTEFLLKKAETQPGPVLDVGFEPSLPSRILDADEPHPLAETLPETADAAGQTFVICYVSAQAAESRRRITVHALKRTPESLILLLARCAETREVMTFRADRIRSCMDINGEVHEPPAVFLAEIFGLGPADAEHLAAQAAGRGIVWPPKDEGISVLRQQLRNELTLLTAMAESDGQVSLVESEAILAFINQRAEALGIHLDEARVQKLQAYIRRLRPTREQIAASVDAIGARPVQAQLELVNACADVMLADGEAHTKELGLLRQIQSELVNE